uniref:Cytochrome c oxidase subunit 3 n=1 Tax=Euseius sacchari TaxID=3061191 RepID=A0AAU6PCL9_9ACAR
MTNKHPFHIVDLSPWPLVNSLNLFNFVFWSLMMFKYPSPENSMNLSKSIFALILTSFLWWRDICREGSYQGHHTFKVYKGMKISMLAFISSEIMFFFSFFWAFFHFSLSPEMEISNSWPPLNIEMINPFHLPLLNSIILISSGASVTWCHLAVLNKKYFSSMFSIFLTISLGMLFSSIQMMEYMNMIFCINDNVYGSTFYMLTGFHGAHVLIGTLFLIINMLRIWKSQVNNKHHFSLEAAAWYWHFVDVVWIYLYIFLYWWWF